MRHRSSTCGPRCPAGTRCSTTSTRSPISSTRTAQRSFTARGRTSRPWACSVWSVRWRPEWGSSCTAPSSPSSMTSSKDVVVAFDDVGKRFRRYDVNHAPTLKRFVLSGFRRTEAERFWALRHVSGEVTRGSTVGLIGRNGAGKSTLLRLLAGVGRADEGTISAHGRIGALLDLGKEFNPELSGRENAMAAGVIAGLTIKQVEAILPQVIEFSELGAFMDNSLRNYSAGMQARLAFGMAVHV